MKKIIFFFVICYSLIGIESSSDSFLTQNYEIPDFILLTIPKSGSHALEKLLRMILIQYKNNTNIKKKYIMTHCAFTMENKIVKENMKYYSDYSYKKIILVRDLRDVCVSLTYWYKDRPLNELKIGLNYTVFFPAPWEEYCHWYKNIDFNEQLLAIIKGYPINQMTPQAKAAIKLIKTPNTYVCHFENLIGLQGGGSKEIQISEIWNIIHFLQLEDANFSDKFINYLSENLYGNKVFTSKTFRKGRINSWKNHFTKEHIQAFKEYLSQDNIELGYENDW